MPDSKSSRGYLSATLGCRCPRCREGKLFKNPIGFNFTRTLEMNKTCPVCGQPTELEVGFYYGTSYVSYAMTVAISVATLVAWYVLIGMSTKDNRFFYWLGTNAIFLIAIQPWLMRLSRSIWISWFVKFEPNWKIIAPEDVSERLNPDHANNW
ncbi:MAG: DUF983 domain-containing protein [Chitinophagaceae bacterium]|nr:DUF983 domain-containing protein [Chitinophagaceae bacterium]